MNQFLLRLVVAAAALASAAPALAADIDVPPPVDELRPATYDWSGGHVGIYAAGVAVEGRYDGVCPCGATYSNIEHSGIGYAGGILAGYNFQMDNFVFGIEGDWGMGNKVASNWEPGIDTQLSFDNIATLRARLGFAEGNTLFYLTGGAVAVDMEFAGQMASWASDNTWAWGWTVGGGIEHAFTDSLTARLEYLYLGLPDTDFSLTDTAGTTFTATQTFDDAHLIRAALTYNFTW